jgi:pyruvate decarboxylase
MVRPNKIPLARYLFSRLHQQGVHAIHGVPGDFTLKALDHVSPAGLKWVGTCNELNAGYAADGYARVHGLSAIMTTYGVGELSVINAIAGSFAEWVSVVSIVGTPQRRLQEECKNVHHTLGDGRPRVFAEMAKHVTVAQTNLVDERTAADEIDRVIATSLRESRPVYVEMPADMVGKEVDADRLEQSLEIDKGTGDGRGEEMLREELLSRIYNARQPLLLVDSGGGVRQLREEINAFIKTSGIPTLCMPSGNNMVDHAHTNFYGVHSGPVGQIDTMPYVRDTDLVLAFGPMFSDTQTLSWKVVPEAEKIITLNKNSIQSPSFNNGQAAEIDLSRFLKRLTKQFDRSRVNTAEVSSLGNFRTVKSPAYAKPDGVSLDDPIDQTSFYLRLSPYLRPHDTIILGNATPILGGRDLVLPAHAEIIASGQWFSIGHMFPLSMGVSLARQHQQQSQGRPAGRTILLDGDGGFQVTAQELGTVIRYRIPMTIFLVNNAGYAYERQIHGMHEDYNDLAPWRYTELARVLGASEAQLAGSKQSPNFRTGLGYKEGARELYPVRNYTIHTWRDLEELLADGEFTKGEGLHFVDVRVGKFDVPEKFRVVFERAGEALGS